MKIELKNNAGRDYSIQCVVNKNMRNIKNITLKQGINYLTEKEWDKIKDHPNVKSLLKTKCDFCLKRIKKIPGSTTDIRYILVKEDYNTCDNQNFSLNKFEVVDSRNI